MLVWAANNWYCTKHSSISGHYTNNCIDLQHIFVPYSLNDFKQRTNFQLCFKPILTLFDHMSVKTQLFMFIIKWAIFRLNTWLKHIWKYIQYLLQCLHIFCMELYHWMFLLYSSWKLYQKLHSFLHYYLT